MTYSKYPNVIDSEGISAILMNCSGAVASLLIITPLFSFITSYFPPWVRFIKLDYLYQNIKKKATKEMKVSQ